MFGFRVRVPGQQDRGRKRAKYDSAVLSHTLVLLLSHTLVLLLSGPWRGNGKEQRPMTKSLWFANRACAPLVRVSSGGSSRHFAPSKLSTCASQPARQSRRTHSLTRRIVCAPPLRPQPPRHTRVSVTAVGCDGDGARLQHKLGEGGLRGCGV